MSIHLSDHVRQNFRKAKIAPFHPDCKPSEIMAKIIQISFAGDKPCVRYSWDDKRWYQITDHIAPLQTVQGIPLNRLIDDN